MSSSQLLLAHFPQEWASIVFSHAKIYVGVTEKETEGMYQIGWAMYFYEDEDCTIADEQEPLQMVKDLSLSPDELNSVLDAFQALPSIYGDDDESCHYKMILAH